MVGDVLQCLQSCVIYECECTVQKPLNHLSSSKKLLWGLFWRLPAGSSVHISVHPSLNGQATAPNSTGSWLSSLLVSPCCRHTQASPIPWSNSSPLHQTANCGCERVLHPELSPSTLGFIASGYKSFFLLSNRMTQCPCWAEKFRRQGLAPLSATSPFTQISAGQPGTEMQSESSSSLVHGEAVRYHAKSLSAATTGPVSCLNLVF